MKNIKHVNVEYIESGTFCGGEESCYDAGIKRGSNYIVISPEDFEKFKQLRKVALEASEILDEVRTGEDFECVCWEKAEEIRKMLGGTKKA